MSIGHIITGYDKQTERVAVEHPISDETFEEARALADVPATDTDATANYPMTESQVRTLALKADLPLLAELYDWFLEPA